MGDREARATSPFCKEGKEGTIYLSEGRFDPTGPQRFSEIPGRLENGSTPGQGPGAGERQGGSMGKGRALPEPMLKPTATARGGRRAGGVPQDLGLGGKVVLDTSQFCKGGRTKGGCLSEDPAALIAELLEGEV